MSLLVPSAAQLLALQWMISATSTPENLTLKLYTNTYTPVSTSTTGNFTEATFTGYSAKTLSRGTWNAATTSTNGQATITYPSQSFTCTGGGGQVIVGYFVIGASSGSLIWAELFSTSRNLTSGNSLSLVPTLNLGTLTS